MLYQCQNPILVIGNEVSPPREIRREKKVMDQQRMCTNLGALIRDIQMLLKARLEWRLFRWVQ